MSSVTIRAVEKKDILTVYEQICELEEIRFDIKTFEIIFLNNINDKNKLYYLAQDDKGECLGFIGCHIQYLLHHCGKVAEIQELFVKKSHRGLGIGRNLIGFIEKLIKGLDCVSLEVTAQNKRIKTHHFYIKSEFTQSHLKFTKSI